MRPTPGRIVNFRSTGRDTAPWPAVILSVHDDGTVDLNVFKPGLLEFARNKSMAENFEKSEPGEWSWPERV